MDFQKLSAVIASFFLSIILGMIIIIFLLVLFNDTIHDSFIYISIAFIANGFILFIIYTLTFIPLSIYGKDMLKNSVGESYTNVFPLISIPPLLIGIIIISINPCLITYAENWFWIADIYGIINTGLWLFLNSIIDSKQKAL